MLLLKDRRACGALIVGRGGAQRGATRGAARAATARSAARREGACITGGRSAVLAVFKTPRATMTLFTLLQV